MDVDDSREKPLLLAIQANSFKSLGLCFPKSVDEQKKHSDAVLDLLAANLDGNVWNIRLAILDSLEKILIEKMTEPTFPFGEKTFAKVVQGLLQSLEDSKYSAIREKAADVLLAVTDKHKDVWAMWKSSKELVVKQLEGGLIDRESVTMVEEKLKKIKENLK